MSQNSVIIRQLNRRGYESVLHAMQSFTDTRTDDTPDEIWLVEHEPVFTQGQAGKEEHLLMPGDIPVIKVDRGGQVTYHGPGQQVLYVMFNLRRLKIGIRELVTWLEEAIVETLVEYGIKAYAKPDAPGVYVDDSKIASLGLRVRKGCSFHGLALNINMDLTPFSRINPCGYAGMTMIQSKDLSCLQDLEIASDGLISSLLKKLQKNNTDLKSIKIQGFDNE